MYHDLLGRASFWLFLLAIDRDLAESARRRNCSCGGRLHHADYRRKPRGGENLPEEYGCRLSFCCDRDGCRKRVTPPSVRFLGQKVYLGAVVVLIAAMQQGPSPKRVARLSELVGADRRTLARWRVFWTEHFPQTPFWKVARGGFRVAVEAGQLPLALVEAVFHPEDLGRSVGRLLFFLSPITVTGGLAAGFS